MAYERSGHTSAALTMQVCGHPDTGCRNELPRLRRASCRGAFVTRRASSPVVNVHQGRLPARELSYGLALAGVRGSRKRVGNNSPVARLLAGPIRMTAHPLRPLDAHLFSAAIDLETAFLRFLLKPSVNFGTMVSGPVNYQLGCSSMRTFSGLDRLERF